MMKRNHSFKYHKYTQRRYKLLFLICSIIHVCSWLQTIIPVSLHVQETPGAQSTLAACPSKLHSAATAPLCNVGTALQA